MKKLLTVFLLAGCIISNILAQETPASRYHEFGIIFSDLNNFGLRYKYGSEKTMLRVSLLALNLGSSKETFDPSGSPEHKQTGYGAGFQIGFDSRVALFKNFSLLLGGEAGVRYNYNHVTVNSNGNPTDDFTSTSLSPGLSFIFGANYIVKDHLVLGAEINPTLSYVYNQTKFKEPNESTDKTNGIVFNLVTSGAGLYIAFRFGK